MNTTRLEIMEIEKQIQALEAEAEALLRHEADASHGNKQAIISLPQERKMKCFIFKAPPQLH
ncbi:MAG: hypothetical protein EON54_05730 [Alcaligenaceae bacterium]|nr:MAG: hypothetical protein EON54_05730 [Alcaligenaceae bacterium]